MGGLDRQLHFSTTLEKAASQKKDLSFQKLSNSELQEKKDKGLCFQCDEKFTLGHCCKKKELRIMLVSSEDDSEFEEGDKIQSLEAT